MKSKGNIFLTCLAAAFLIATTIESAAFSLLGPFQPWMQATNNVIQFGDIGGPMPLGCGYRWNVPVLTYGFDQSFLNYFGTNGVAAAESAIQILNSLPPASQVVLTNYPFDTVNENFQAQSQSLTDLKSAALSVLLAHLGLASPSRYVYTLQHWSSSLTNETSTNLISDVFDGTNLESYILALNYDPQSLTPSPAINGIVFTGTVFDYGFAHAIASFPVSTFPPIPPTENTVTGQKFFGLGEFYSGLTYDDIGGLSYLYSTNTVYYETLLSGVTGAGTNSTSFVNGAWRPGVDKVTFIPQPVDPQSGLFLPTTNSFTDNYLTNGVIQQQQLQRIVSRPDFLFSAGDVSDQSVYLPSYRDTGTTNWLNNAAANGNANSAGPGVIQPPVQIAFNKLGRYLSSGEFSAQLSDNSSFWGSFDGSTNAPVVYPISGSSTNQMTLRMWLVFGYPQINTVSFWTNFVWKPSSQWGASFAFQSSPDLLTWTTLFSLTNNGSVSSYANFNPPNSSGFFRLIPQ